MKFTIIIDVIAMFFGRQAVSYKYINSHINNNMKSTNSTSRRKHKNQKNVVVCGEWFLVMDP